MCDKHTKGGPEESSVKNNSSTLLSLFLLYSMEIIALLVLETDHYYHYYVGNIGDEFRLLVSSTENLQKEQASVRAMFLNINESCVICGYKDRGKHFLVHSM